MRDEWGHCQDMPKETKGGESGEEEGDADGQGRCGVGDDSYDEYP